MDHCEYIKIAESKKTAILMIHGILGTPRHFDAFLDVIPEDWSVFNILLDGHGKTVTDFSHTSMKKWKRQVLKIMSRLNKEYDEIVIMGHSMGTLLGIMASFAYPHKVKYMFLLNVPLHFYMHPVVMKNAFQILFMKGKRDASATNMKMAGSITTTRKLWKYIGWIPRYLELFQLIRQTRERLHLVQIPTYTFQSRHDELVLQKSNTYLDNHPIIENRILENSGHFGYASADMNLIKETMRKVIAEK